MSDFRKPRADHPIYPTSAIYRPTTSKGFIVPKGLKGKKGGKKRKKGKKATYDPDAIARVHQQTSRNKERELLQEQLDYRRAQRVVEDEQRVRAAELAEERRNDERARFALEARQMRDQRNFFLRLGHAAAGIAAGVGARAGAAGGAIGGGGGGGALGGGAVGGAAPPHAGMAIPLPDAPRYTERDLQRGIAEAEDRMRAAAEGQQRDAVDAIRREAGAEVDAARRAGRLSDEQAARARAELEQRFAEQMDGLESRARAAEIQAAEGEEEIARLRAQVLEGRVESAEALRRLQAIAEQQAAEPQAEGGLVRQTTGVRTPRRAAPTRTASQTIARDIEGERTQAERSGTGGRDTWADATQRLVKQGAFAGYGVPEMDEVTQTELDQIRQRLVFSPGMSRREKSQQTARMNARWFDFLERRRIETGARGTFRPRHSPSMEALSAQLALEDQAQPEPEGQIGGEPRGPTPPPEGSVTNLPQPPGGRSRGRGGGSRGRSSRNVVSPEGGDAFAGLERVASRADSDAARSGLQSILQGTQGEGEGEGGGPAVRHTIGGDPKSQEGLPRAERDIEPAARAVGRERPKEFVPEVGVEPVKPTPRPKTPPIIIGIPGQPRPEAPRVKPLVRRVSPSGNPDPLPPEPVPPHVEPEPQAEGGIVRPFGKNNIVRHKKSGRLGWVSQGGIGDASMSGGGADQDAIQVSFFKNREAARTRGLDRLTGPGGALAPPEKLDDRERREHERLKKKSRKADSDRLLQKQVPTRLSVEESDRLADLETREIASLQLPTDPHQSYDSTFSAVDEGDITPEERLELLRQIGKQTNRNVRLSHAKENQPFQERLSFEGKRLWLESDDWRGAGGKAYYRLSKRAQEEGEGEGERLFIHSYDVKKDTWLIQREKGHKEGVTGAKKNASGRANISHDELVRHLQAQQVRLRRDGDQGEGGGFLAGAAEAAGAVGRLGADAAGMMGGAVGGAARGAARIAWEAAGSPTARGVAEGTGRLAARAVTGAGSAALEVGGGLVGLAAEGVADAFEAGVRAPQRVAQLPSAPGGQTGFEQTGRPGARLLTQSEIEAEQAPVATFRGSGGAAQGPRVITDPRPVGVRLGSPVGIGAANEPPVDWGTPRGGARSGRDPQQGGGG